MRLKLLLVAAVAAFSACATHQRPTDPRVFDWASVTALTVEERIEVTTRDGRRLVGTVESVDAMQVVLGRPVTIALRRDDVLSIWAIGLEDSLFNGYLLGAIAGFALGAAIPPDDETSIVFPAIASGVGAIAGAWIDRQKAPPRRLVYIARN